MKVVGIGLNKTGTTSLGACLQHWGYRHISHSHEAFLLWRDGDINGLLEWVSRYDSFEDWPWPLVYREIDAAFPGTKFILTRRKNPDVWFTSLCKHAELTGPTDFREAIYGYAMPKGHKAEHIRMYNQHLEAVRDYFKDRPNDFLEVCWEEGDGWKELGEFLGLQPPGIAFPHLNQSIRFRDKVKALLLDRLGLSRTA